MRIGGAIACLVIGAGLGACAAEPSRAPVAVAAEYKPAPHAPGPMQGVRATRMGGVLAAAGLDVKNLPPIEQLTPAQKQKVMRTFTETLGIPCLGCHAEDEFRADTRRKRIAKRMYNEMVRALTLRDGEPVYCDTCHDGTMYMLDRQDTAKLVKHMSETLVGQFARVDGRNHDCSTCHGEPPDYHMLTTWKGTTAPDIVSIAEPASATVLTPPLPDLGRREPADCGPHSEKCPLQRWMRGYVSIATSTDDVASLAIGLDRVALFSPDPTWSWESISRNGATAARAGDLATAKKSCATCHELYKTKWRASHRTRTAP
ncbi:MAG: hypothetical protein JWO86_2301 [Myxococcaceae bacterium]|nr:hypothetical protein [Myxococcaceae bacterium]